LEANCSWIEKSTCHGDFFLCASSVDCHSSNGQNSTCVSVPNNTYFIFFDNCTSLPPDWSIVDSNLCSCAEEIEGLPTFLRYVSIFVLFLVCVFLVYPVKIPLKFIKTKKPFSIMLDYATVPLIGVLLLYISGAINLTNIAYGIVGNENLRPYEIIILFFALAYLCCSLDITGLFDFLSIYAVNATNGSGIKLYFVIAILTLITLLTSNDTVILTLTPIICSLSEVTTVDPIPFSILQFFLANIWSIAILVGNPTNIIVAEAYNIPFLEYSKWMLMPAVACGVSCTFFVWIRFRSSIPVNIPVPELVPMSFFKDKAGAIYGTCCLLSCLILLGLSSLIGVRLWIITVIFASLMLVKDIHFDFKRRNIPPHEVEDTKQTYQTIQVIQRLPWKIMFFVIGVFIIVEALHVAKWTSDLASLLSFIIGEEDTKRNTVTAVFLVGFLSSLVCNILNNQPMTILFTTVLQEGTFRVSANSLRGAMYALIMGSNLGANFTLIGALAGIMWSSILENRKVKITFLQFAQYGFVIMPFVVFIGCSVLAIELLITN